MATALRSIGAVLDILKAEFPDISISKIRFLESEGLVSPERAPSGYRRYAESDIDRLRYILTVQRDHYLPLKVIRQHLEMIDQGMQPPSLEVPTPQPATEEQSAPVPKAAATRQVTEARKRPIKMNRRQLIEASNIDEATMVELERQQIIHTKRGGYYGREALTIALAAAKLKKYGFDTRHMRLIRQAAEREAGLVEQAIQPYLRRPAIASAVASEVTQLVVHAHAAMMHTVLER